MGGYIALVHQNWAFTLFYLSSLWTPTGTNIVFLDSIPIVSLIGKIASQTAGHILNPYGVWLEVCVILSAVFASLWHVAELGQRTVLAATAAAILSVTAPPLLYRFGHLSLMAHWIVLCALYLYLRNRRDPSVPQYAIPWVGLLCIALLVNVYLFVMAGSLFAATFLQRFFQNVAELQEVVYRRRHCNRCHCPGRRNSGPLSRREPVLLHSRRVLDFTP